MLKSIRLFAIATMMLSTFSATGARAPSAPTPIQASSAPSQVPDAVAGASTTPSDYKLGVADHVRMTVYNEPDLSGEFSVSANGAISLPLIGDVGVLGLTVSQVSDVVQKKLSQGYLRDPRVSLEILTFRPFFILGEVTKPGEYAYSNGLTVLNAVATAEGYTYRANKKRVFIKHAGASDEANLKITPGLLVQPGDTIRVGERYF